jgi:hypothetical protein
MLESKAVNSLSELNLKAQLKKWKNNFADAKWKDKLAKAAKIWVKSQDKRV